jgi:GNAT superfamily N-acetyltransferase
MANSFSIDAVTGLHPGLALLQDEADREGFNFVRRLVDDYHSGANRFDRRGEALIGAIQKDALVGICGLNRDPYLQDPSVGRLRHLYVRPAMRGQGIGTSLVETLLAGAHDVFAGVRLRTDRDSAARFYQRLGFQPVRDATASHVKMIR